MPTKNPRLTITMQPALAAQLRRLSELTGNSQGSLIAELLEGSGPVFDRLINVLEAAKDVKASFRDSLVSDLAAAQSKIEGQLGLSLEAMDEATLPLLDEAEKVKRRARRKGSHSVGKAPARKVATPLSNRGVRSDKKQAKKGSR
jgi:hypothetical protein